MDTRRDFLKKSILFSGTTGILNAFPASVKKALSIDPSPGSTYLDAEHVVILMQENRSFDHCFGALRGVRGFNDPRLITLPNGNIVWLQSDNAGKTYAPFRFDIDDTKATWMGSLPHTRHSQVDADNYGKYDRWLEAKRSGHKKYDTVPLTLGHYNREDLPFNYSFADAFTICDQHFCSVKTGTWPNRLYFWSGTVREEKSSESKAFVRNDIPYGTAHWKTFPERLEENGISWKVYQNDLSCGGGFTDEERNWLANVTGNPLEFLSQYNVRFHDRYLQSLKKLIDSLPSKITGLEKKLSVMNPSEKGYDKLQKEIIRKKEVLAEKKLQLEKWNTKNFEKLSQFQKDIYQKAFTTNMGDPGYRQLTTFNYGEGDRDRHLLIPKGDILYQFRKDVDTSRLPTVSWIVPPCNLSDHPTAPWYGAWYTSEILDILTKNPEVWKKTIFILTYDENDGYFDHIPPYVVPDPKDPATGKCSPGINATGAEFVHKEQEIKEGIRTGIARTAPIGLGFRVPMIIASPWSRGGKVCSQIFDHTSTLQFLEHFLNKKFNLNIKETNISQWRRAVCGNLTSVFDNFDEKTDQKIDFLKMDPYIERIYNAKFKRVPNDYKALKRSEITAINQDPASSSLMTHQEPGKRVARPIPYQLYADGGLSYDKKEFILQMKAAKEIFGDQAAGSPFKVYAPGKYKVTKATYKDKGIGHYETARSWDYAVTAGGELSDNWPLENFENSAYHLCLYGPNGFFRAFRGNKSDPSLNIKCDYQTSGILKTRLTGNVFFHMENSGDEPLIVLITDKTYHNKPLKKKINPGDKTFLILALTNSSGWYDFQISLEKGGEYSCRYAGHVETGKESYSDPAMGREF